MLIYCYVFQWQKNVYPKLRKQVFNKIIEINNYSKTNRVSYYGVNKFFGCLNILI